MHTHNKTNHSLLYSTHIPQTQKSHQSQVKLKQRGVKSSRCGVGEPASGTNGNAQRVHQPLKTAKGKGEHNRECSFCYIATSEHSCNPQHRSGATRGDSAARRQHWRRQNRLFWHEFLSFNCFMCDESD
jgi:hypothetical protein